MIKILTILFWLIFPIIVLVASQFLIKFSGIKKYLSINAADLGTFFLIYGIFEMTSRLFTNSILPNFCLSLLFIALTVIGFQIYRYQEFYYGKFFKMFWRLTFLFSIFIYFVCWLVLVVSI
ncbi:MULTISPECIES: DUF3397 domain-containing protein [unclassified Enterococcus]|uniref:DUF3397 domain-containing protein n=1 Tax=unclassified Enterococcus TaxID=2608891 RepID=UPI0015516707|nr:MULTISPECIES: DUF3397 domain-containing protein [unclassified Enterococcus]MBS7576278.1 DUF3397 domain-containing protein [Enterococcus sp. MMGLQ5-2]MBS7583511.1 DUF3397 domain-containing protein [Enterococcus sp. MMGLQ5-1]NPD11373.1 DUF3397 domain-containing protein [Enterococcus sp. MMGLQ5-1]NPD36116.1 DUF3397 domain-containing protein [Enterococcus sp. MMGLQ5-2]